MTCTTVNREPSCYPTETWWLRRKTGATCPRQRTRGEALPIEGAGAAAAPGGQAFHVVSSEEPCSRPGGLGTLGAGCELET